MNVSIDTNAERVQALFIGYFGRAAEPEGLDYWVGQLNSGTLTYGQIAASFSVQSEAKSQYSFLANQNGADADAFVNQVYTNLFNRAADAPGLAYWSSQLEARQGDPQAIGNSSSM